MRPLRLTIALLCLVGASFAPSVQGQQQPPNTPAPSNLEVVGFSYLVPGDGGSVVAYAGTEMGIEVTTFYDCEADGYLYENGSEVNHATAVGNPTAEGQFSATAAAATFELQTNHFLLPIWFLEDGSDWDVYGFSQQSSAFQVGWIDVGAPNEVPDELPSGPYIEIGSTTWTQFGALPVIYSITPATGNQLTLGASGTLQITGAWLSADGTDPSPTVNVSGSGLSLGSPQVVNDGQLNVSYSVSTDPGSARGYGITVTTVAGPSINTYNVTVGDPTPAITGISPSSWNAGQSYSCSIQVQGSGFGTNPSVQITSADGGGEIASYSVCGSSSNWPAPDQVTLSVMTNTNYSPGAVNVTVTSRGYNGSSFQPSQQNNSNQSVAQTVSITPTFAGPPTVSPRDNSGVNHCGFQSIPGTQSVVVGQRIAITGCLPPGVPIADLSSQTWMFPGNLAQNAVGGYNPANGTNNQVIATSAPACTTTQNFCDFPDFYWVVPNLAPAQYTFQYTYTLKNNAGSWSATVVYSVSGPMSTGANGAFLTATVQPPPPAASPAQIVSVWPPQGNSAMYTRLEMGDGEGSTPTPGIVFNVAAQPPDGNAGAFEFVQVIASSGYSYLTNPGLNGGVGTPTGNIGTGLDNWYPYATAINNPLQALDYPSLNFALTSGAPVYEATFTFKAQMYLLWDPALPGSGQSSCSAASNRPTAGGANPVQSTCMGSIPVPLGYAVWGFSGCAVNSLNPNAAQSEIATGSANQTGWVLMNCSGPFAPTVPQNVAFQTSSFPAWAGTAHN